MRRRSRLRQAAIAFLALTACGDSYSPTAPAPPALVPPAPEPIVGAIVTAWGFELDPDSGKAPQQVNVFVDGKRQYGGSLREATPWDYSGFPYWIQGQLEGLIAGRHTLTLEMTLPAVRKEGYRLYAFVQLRRVADGKILANDFVAQWSESVTLTKGQSWTGEFEIRE